MKKFVNKSTHIIDGSEEEKKKLGYADLLLVGINSAPKEGTTIPEMRMCMKISEILDKVKLGAEVKFEDADFDFAVGRIPKTWSVVHKDIIAFCDYIDELKK